MMSEPDVTLESLWMALMADDRRLARRLDRGWTWQRMGAGLLAFLARLGEPGFAAYPMLVY